MKKLLIILAACLLLTSLCSCSNGGGEITLPPEGSVTEADGSSGKNRTNIFCFAYNGVYLAPHDEMSVLLPSIGEPVTYEESESCAYVGLDKVYVYNGFTIFTYPDNGVDKILQIVLTDDSLTTTEGIRVGDSSDKVTSTYGSNFSEVSGIYTYTKGQSALQFTEANGVVKAVQYVAVD